MLVRTDDAGMLFPYSGRMLTIYLSKIGAPFLILAGSIVSLPEADEAASLPVDALEHCILIFTSPPRRAKKTLRFYKLRASLRLVCLDHHEGILLCDPSCTLW